MRRGLERIGVAGQIVVFVAVSLLAASAQSRNRIEDIELHLEAIEAPGSPTPREEPRLTQANPDSERRDNSVSEEDVEILAGATRLLADESGWNRSDDRECDDDEATDKRSLFCALQKASIEVLGEYDHRRVALQEVRFAIQDVTGGREFAHRLMDFNNLAETTLADIHDVLRISTERVEARLESNQ